MSIKKIISPILIVLYLAAVVGFGLYNCYCNDKQSVDIALLTTNDDCCQNEAGNKSNPPCSDDSGCQNSTDNASCSSNNTNDCCKTVYKSIKIDQEHATHQVKALTYASILITAILPSSIGALQADCGINNPFNYSKSPPGSGKTSLIYRNCQLRL